MSFFSRFCIPDYDAGVCGAGDEQGAFSAESKHDYRFDEVAVAAAVLPEAFAWFAGGEIPGPYALVPAAGEDGFGTGADGEGG
jgi:hypothetical protein